LDRSNEPVQDQEHAACSLDASHVLTWEEIANLAAEPGKPAETLTNVVALIARRFGTDVCSAYLLEPDRANLVLAATIGLRRECVGKLRMAVSEGLAGLVAEQVRPVVVEQVRNHPRFKYFSEAGEDAYQSFLGVPLIDRGVLQGVLVVQTVGPHVFTEEETRLLTEAANRVAHIVSEARTLALTVPASVRPESLHTMLSVAPSLAAEMLGSLEFLTSYPYGCTEQTLSSFLPNLVVRAAMKDLGAAGVDDAALDKMIRTGVKRLIDFQNEKGGWGFWRGRRATSRQQVD